MTRSGRPSVSMTMLVQKRGPWSKPVALTGRSGRRSRRTLDYMDDVEREAPANVVEHSRRLYREPEPYLSIFQDPTTEWTCYRLNPCTPAASSLQAGRAS